MSLINDVLKDLERRQAPQSANHRRPPLPVTRHRPGGKILWWLGIAVVAGLALHLGLRSQPPRTSTDAPLHAAMPQSQPEPEAIGLVPDSLPSAPVAIASNSPGPDQAPEAESVGMAASPDQTDPAPVATEAASSAATLPPAVASTNSRRHGVESAGAPDPRSSPGAVSRQPVRDQQEQAGISIQRAITDQAPDTHAELDAARRALAREHHAEARRRIEALLARDPGHDEARLLLAGNLIQHGDARSAIALLDQGLDHSADPAELARLLGRILIDRGETTRARQLLEAHAPEPTMDPDYHQLLAAAHRQAGDHEAAMHSYRQLADIVPGRGAIWIGLGASLESLDRNNEAIEAYARALEGNDPRAARFARQRLNALSSADGDR